QWTGQGERDATHKREHQGEVSQYNGGYAEGDAAQHPCEEPHSLPVCAVTHSVVTILDNKAGEKRRATGRVTIPLLRIVEEPMGVTLYLRNTVRLVGLLAIIMGVVLPGYYGWSALH